MRKKYDPANDCYAKFMESCRRDGYHFPMKTEEWSAFRHNLAACRGRLSLTQEQLAEILGVSRTAVAKWEAGFGMPSLQNLVNLSRLFAQSIDMLLFGDLRADAPAETGRENREET